VGAGDVVKQGVYDYYNSITEIYSPNQLLKDAIKTLLFPKYNGYPTPPIL